MASYRDSLSDLLQRHAELETKYDDGNGGHFLSGWQCDNPWADAIRKEVEQRAANLTSSEYQYFDRDSRLAESILGFHSQVDEIRPDAAFCAAGATPLIFAFCVWLRQQGIQEVYYVRPLYFTLHYALKLLGIRVRAVSGRHPFEHEFTFNLPKDSSTLLLSDPIWYAGVPLSKDLVSSIIDWQSETGSFVFVDGSFQYAGWAGQRSELTAALDPARTIRLICPTKALAMHGYRFAYALLPRAVRPAFVDICANIYGSSSVGDIAFANAAIAALTDGFVPRHLMTRAAERHQRLRQRCVISAPWQPSCGYFVFERVPPALAKKNLMMDGSFFEQKRYPDYRRLNLLSPLFYLLE